MNAITAIFVALIGAAATIASALIPARSRIPLPWHGNKTQLKASDQVKNVGLPPPPLSPEPHRNYAYVQAVQPTSSISKSVILGCVALLIWLIPVAGIPISLVGIGIGVSELAY